VPTLFVQIQNFPQIANINRAVRDNAYFQPGEWHNIAVTIANAADVHFYLDGEPLVSVEATGRPFNATDIDTLQPCGYMGGNGEHPSTTDDLIVVNRVLGPEEIAQYWKAVTHLKQMGFPPIVPGDRLLSNAAPPRP
jgi:hypothetical protein